MIQILQPDLLLTSLRGSLLPPGSSDQGLDEAFLGEFVRRTAGIACPCSRNTLVRRTFDLLSFLPNDGLEEKVEETVDGLLWAGDLVELDDVAISEGGMHNTWLFATPPSYVTLAKEEILLFGIAKDDAQFLPAEISDGLAFRRYARVLSNTTGKLPAMLEANGVRKLSLETWIPTPKPRTAEVVVTGYNRQLHQGHAALGDEKLQIIARPRDTSLYISRWKQVKTETGIYVARRPRSFGTPAWGLCELAGGATIRFMNFPSKSATSRACDLAWYMQLAMDAVDGKPQQVRVRSSGDAQLFLFSGPIPQWARRRLFVLGDPQNAQGQALFAYRVPSSRLDQAKAFLTEHLWMEVKDD